MENFEMIKLNEELKCIKERQDKLEELITELEATIKYEKEGTMSKLRRELEIRKVVEDHLRLREQEKC